MDSLLYLVALGVVKFLQALPLLWVARFGRFAGGLAWWLDARHRRVALSNLTMCFASEKSPAQIRQLARENFLRIGENFASSVKTAAMSLEEARPHFEFAGTEKLLAHQNEQGPQSCVVAVGHFGNFELCGRFGQIEPSFTCATTYRGLRQPSLNRLLLSLRQRSGALLFERRTEAAALKAAMGRPGLLLGLFADQNAKGGVRIPFFGHECAASTAPAVFALRYNCPLHTGICYRVGLARWRVEAGDEIPTRENGRPRSVEAITLDINRAFETAIRRDPANWFWVHNRWKAKKSAVAKIEPATVEEEE